MTLSIDDIELDRETLHRAEFATEVIPAVEIENYLREQGYSEETIKDALSVSGQPYMGIAYEK